MQPTPDTFVKQVGNYNVHTFSAVPFFKDMFQKLITEHPDAEEYATPVDETDERTIVYVVDINDADNFVWTAVDHLHEVNNSLITSLTLDLLHFMEEDNVCEHCN
jgi:hypothetical protein